MSTKYLDNMGQVENALTNLYGQMYDYADELQEWMEDEVRITDDYKSKLQEVIERIETFAEGIEDTSDDLSEVISEIREKMLEILDDYL